MEGNRGKGTVKRLSSSSKPRGGKPASSTSLLPTSLNSSTATATADKSADSAVKVVYISNPMEVNTSASDFQALVQGLTGQDADWSGNRSKLKIPAGCELADKYLQSARSINGSGTWQYCNMISEGYAYSGGEGARPVGDDLCPVSQPFDGFTGDNDDEDRVILIDDDQHLRRQMYFDDFYRSMPANNTNSNYLFK